MKRTTASISGDNKWHRVFKEFTALASMEVDDTWDWCINHPSAGNFDYVIEPLWDSAWWFEYEKDALLFALKWGAS